MMPKLRRGRISKRTVDALSIENKETVFWDRELQGFGVRVYPSGAKVYVAQCRSRGKSKRVTLGRHGLLTPDQARLKAARTLARLKGLEEGLDTAPAQARRGIDPAPDLHGSSTGDGVTGPVHRQILSGLLRRYDRPVMSNVHRATYAECLVAELLAPDWTPPWTRGHDRAAWDLDHRSGRRMKIEQSAALRPWHGGRVERTRTARFDIAPRKGYWTMEDAWIEQPGRPADIYVFAWHGEENEFLADQREPEQWRFFLVPTSILPADQPNIGLPGLRNLADAVGFRAMRASVQETLVALRQGG